MNRFFTYWMYLTFVLFIIPAYQLFAIENDSTTIQFSKKNIDFNIIYEADGTVPVKFEFTNTGKTPLTINRIIAPGIKQIDYPQFAIPPGETGVIVATIDPFRRIGYFKKSINVFTNTTTSPDVLSVNGKVLYGTYKSSFKHNIGDLAFKQLQLNFGYVFNGDITTRYIQVLNNSEKKLGVSYKSVPKHLSIRNRFKELTPGTTGIIEITYNTNVINDWDFVLDKIALTIKGSSNVSGEIAITANIRENFKLLSEEEKVSLPKVSIPIKVFNYDTISSGNKVNYEFPIYNHGTRELNIRAVKPTCGCTAVVPQKSVLSPGDSTLISVEFNSIGLSGFDKKGVTVITNDPHNYKHFLMVTGYIE